MPTYEFVCQACLRRFEKFLPRVIKDEEKVCPNCGSEETIQVFSNDIQTTFEKFTDPGENCGNFGGFG